MGVEGEVDGRGGKEGVREDIVVFENPRTAYEQKEMALGEIWGGGRLRQRGEWQGERRGGEGGLKER